MNPDNRRDTKNLPALEARKRVGDSIDQIKTIAEEPGFRRNYKEF